MHAHTHTLKCVVRAQSFSGLQSIDVAGSAISLVSHIKLLGMTLDSHLTISEHTKLVSQSSFYHIRALRHIRGMLDQSTAAAIASALIFSRLNYANSVLFGLPAKYITRLQRVQNAAARTVAQKSSYLSSVNTLRELHWLPIQWCIKFKLASLTFKATHNDVPPYLSRLLTPYRPSRVLGSSFLLTSCRFLTLTSFSLLAHFVQQQQPFGFPFLTLSAHPIHLTLSGATWKHTISKLLSIPPNGKPQCLWFTCD